ncbi:MAG: HPr family phosphocarrier protein [Clostridia bacterium]|nr:HPr family phosphocarrier protein [Clostridia bacterium]
MQQFTFTITDPQGIHARPAGLLVKEASQFESDISLQCNGKSGDAKRIFSVMGLSVLSGATVTVTAEGKDEDAAIHTLELFFKENF